MNLNLKHFFVIAFIFLCFKINAQWYGPLTELDDAKIMVTYTYTFSLDSTKLEASKSEWMLLFLGNTISNFQSYGLYENHKIGRQKFETGGMDMVIDWMSNSSAERQGSNHIYSIFKNYPEGKITTNEKLILGNRYVYEEDINPFMWQISEDTMRIEGYLCQKAVCDFGGRTWKAWFTAELPYRDGPYKFGGLPGLILNIADTKNHHIFEFRSIESLPEGEKISWEEKEHIKTTKQNFIKARKIHNQGSEVDVSVDVEAVGKIDAYLRALNNPIELEW